MSNYVDWDFDGDGSVGGSVDSSSSATDWVSGSGAAVIASADWTFSSNQPGGGDLDASFFVNATDSASGADGSLTLVNADDPSSGRGGQVTAVLGFDAEKNRGFISMSRRSGMSPNSASSAANRIKLMSGSTALAEIILTGSNNQNGNQSYRHGSVGNGSIAVTFDETNPGNWADFHTFEIAWRDGMVSLFIERFGDDDITVIDVPFSGAAGLIPDSLRLESGFSSASSERPMILDDLLVQLGDAAAPISVDTFTADQDDVSPGTSVQLNWATSDADTVTIEPLAGIFPANGQTSVTLTETTVFTITASSSDGTDTSMLQVLVDGQPLPPSLTEFVADNKESQVDGDGAFPDWIEIYNANLFEIDVSGYHLTDDTAALGLWKFPTYVIPPRQRILVFASGRSASDPVLDAGGFLHTTFKISASAGGYLALIAPDGTTVIDEFLNYPAQREDVSYGQNQLGENRFFISPTPAAPSLGSGVIDFVADTSFSQKRGIDFTSAFSLTISSNTAGAEIFYTIDGSEPSPDNGTLYQSPITISTTTTLRAAAFLDDWEPTNVDTQSYIFLQDVITQPDLAPGYPTIWQGKPADYGMDPEIVTDPAYSGEIIEDFKMIPTLSVVTAVENLFGSTGVYDNSELSGSEWERAVSAELVFPTTAGKEGFQIDCGIRVQGRTSRSRFYPKHSFSLRFRKEYGEGELDYPLFDGVPFGENSTSSFDYLQLRARTQNAWTSTGAGEAIVGQHLRDRFAADAQLALGGPGIHGRFVHLYLNGIYWGVYDMHERPDADHMANYFGGESPDYDSIRPINDTGQPFEAGAGEGDLVAWNEMHALAAGGLSSAAKYAEIDELMDLDHFIDYLLVNFYNGIGDWDGSNWRVAGPRQTGGGFLFFPWDSELSLKVDAVSTANNTNKSGTGSTTGVYDALRDNAEFRLRFADRAHRALFNGGPFESPQAQALWDARAAEINGPIVCESARWGDYRRDVDASDPASHPLYTRDGTYETERLRLQNVWFPQRDSVLLSQLRSGNLYPATDAPVFAQHGGRVANGFSLTMSAPSGGTIFYTLDGSDPRAAGGVIAGTQYTSAPNLSVSKTVKSRVRNGGEWSALTEAQFLVGIPADMANLMVSEIMYHPAGLDEDAEFIELMNISSTETIDLTGVHFTSGVSYQFPDGAFLSPGARTVVTFAEFTSGRLRNQGERIRISDIDDLTIQDFTYSDSLPWPPASDGEGRSMVLISPETAPDHNNPTNWRPSVTDGGNPGTSDTLAFSGIPDADLDSDGIVALVEHAFGRSDSVFGNESFSLALDPAGDALISFPRNLSADDTIIEIQVSQDLEVWRIPATSPVLISATQAPSSVQMETWSFPMNGGARNFVRLAVRLR
ncbi:MAG: lamin tail domain-containing protein [Akkermansiaceae bacterium]